MGGKEAGKEGGGARGEATTRKTTNRRLGKRKNIGSASLGWIGGRKCTGLGLAEEEQDEPGSETKIPATGKS